MEGTRAEKLRELLALNKRVNAEHPAFPAMDRVLREMLTEAGERAPAEKAPPPEGPPPEEGPPPRRNPAVAFGWKLESTNERGVKEYTHPDYPGHTLTVWPNGGWLHTREGAPGRGEEPLEKGKSAGDLRTYLTTFQGHAAAPAQKPVPPRLKTWMEARRAKGGEPPTPTKEILRRTREERPAPAEEAAAKAPPEADQKARTWLLDQIKKIGGGRITAIKGIRGKIQEWQDAGKVSNTWAQRHLDELDRLEGEARGRPKGEAPPPPPGRKPPVEKPPATAPEPPAPPDLDIEGLVRQHLPDTTTPEQRTDFFRTLRDKVVEWRNDKRVPDAWAEKQLRTIRDKYEGKAAPPPIGKRVAEPGEKILPRKIRTAEERAAEPAPPQDKSYQERMRAWVDANAPSTPGETVEQRLNRLHDLDTALDKVDIPTADKDAARRYLADQVNELRGKQRAETAPGAAAPPRVRGAEPTPFKPGESPEQPVKYTQARKLHNDLQGEFVRYTRPDGIKGTGQVSRWIGKNNLIGLTNERGGTTWIHPEDVTHVMRRDKPLALEEPEQVWDPEAKKFVKPGEEAPPPKGPAKGAKVILGEAKRTLRTKEGQTLKEQLAALRRGEPPPEKPPRPPKGRR